MLVTKPKVVIPSKTVTQEIPKLLQDSAKTAKESEAPESYTHSVKNEKSDDEGAPKHVKLGRWTPDEK